MLSVASAIKILARISHHWVMMVTGKHREMRFAIRVCAGQVGTTETPQTVQLDRGELAVASARFGLRQDLSMSPFRDPRKPAWMKTTAANNV